MEKERISFQERLVLKNCSSEGGLPDGCQYFGCSKVIAEQKNVSFRVPEVEGVISIDFQSCLHHFRDFLDPYIRGCGFPILLTTFLWAEFSISICTLAQFSCLSSSLKGVPKEWIWETVSDQLLKMESSKGGLPDSWEYFGSFKVIDEHNLYLGFLRWIVHLYQFSKPIAFFSGFWYAYIMRVWLFYTPDHLNVSFTSTSYILERSL